jgi:antitoxin PrlF
MNAILEAESTLTERYQTTVPEPIRRALQLGKRDKIHYSIRSDGEVVLSKSVASDAQDPALGSFLNFLATDFANHPEQVQGIDWDFVKRIQSLVGTIEVDLEAELSTEDE